MDTTIQNVQNGIDEFLEGTANTDWAQWVAQAGIWFFVGLGVAVLLYIVQALMVGGLARSKGYSFFGNFLLGLVFGVFALIYEAGRPVSYERECVMQDRQAMQIAKELYKLQRAREKSHAQSAEMASRTDARKERNAL